MSRKLFAPTKKRLKKARQDGDIAKSRDFTGAVGSLGAIIGIAIFPQGYHELTLYLGKTFAQAADFHTNHMLLSGAVWSKLLIQLVLPPLVGACVLGTAAEMLQAGVQFDAGLLAPQLKRLSALNGVRRILGLQTTASGAVVPSGLLGFLLKAAAVVIVLPWVAWRLASGKLFKLLGSSFCSAGDNSFITESFECSASKLGEMALVLSLQVVLLSVVFAFVLGAIDLVLQKRSRSTRLRMTAEEYKREMRESEGDPEQQQQRKQLHREVLMHEAIQAVRRATVLVVNKWS